VRKERGAFIDEIQDWFRKRSSFWTLVSFVCLVSIIILQILVILLSGINPHIRNGIYSILLPLLVFFVVSIFWRGSTPTILSLVGVMCLYVGMFFVFAELGSLKVMPPQMANRLGYGIMHEGPPADAVADFYFLMGIFALILSVAVAFRPYIFRARGTPTWVPYPVWTTDNDPKLSYGRSVMRLIPVQSLLRFADQHLVAKYRYIQILIGGRIYFVSPDDWVPEGSNVIREKESGSILGITKVPDGFNIW
jgi:hypothetical protein